HLTREARGEVVRVDLTRSPAAIWTGYSPTLRNTIRRVRQRGFTLHFFEDARGFPFFHPIYRETMERRRAAPFYHFPPAFFEDLHRSLSGRFLYGVVFDGASPISAELCLTDGEELVSLLGGTTTHALPEAANPLLRDGLIRWGRAHRFRIYDLGGGRTAGDSLFRYKRKFGRNDVVPAVVGYRIWNRRIYDRLCAAAGVDGRRETFFPAYRKGERG
ncbi:MAG: GNAT family N-acetyltransferase, partial [Deltaproteobacteria bacterium]